MSPESLKLKKPEVDSSEEIKRLQNRVGYLEDRNKSVEKGLSGLKRLDAELLLSNLKEVNQGVSISDIDREIKNILDKQTDLVKNHDRMNYQQMVQERDTIISRCIILFQIFKGNNQETRNGLLKLIEQIQVMNNQRNEQ